MDGIDIAPLAQVGGNRDIGNCLLHLVVECGERDFHSIGWCKIDTAFKADQLLIGQRGIGAGGDREDHEGPVELIERRQPQPAVGRCPDGPAFCCMPDCPAAQTGVPATPVGELAVTGDRPGRSFLVEKTTTHRPTVSPETSGQHQRAQCPVILDEQSQITVIAARLSARSDETCDAGIGVFLQMSFGDPQVGAQPEYVCIPDRGPQLQFAADPGRGRATLVQRLFEAGRTDDRVREIALLDIGQRVELPGSASDQPQAAVLSLGAGIAADKTQGSLVLEGEATQLHFDIFAQRLSQPGAG